MTEVKTETPSLELIMPTLSLDAAEDPEVTSVVEKMDVQDAEAFRMQQFSPAEMEQINQFAQQINLHDTNIVVTYGSGAQKRLAEFSEQTLSHVRNKDLDQIGPLLSQLMADLKQPQDQKKKGLAGLFSRGANKVEATRAYYGKVESSIDSITGSLEAHKTNLLKDITILDKLYENNKVYFKELTMYIAAGRLALKKGLEEELPALQAKAQQTGLAEDAQEARDFASLCDRFDKKLHDLDLTRTVCLQNAPQIRLIQNNAVVLSDKIQTTLVNTIPLWKNQLVITMGIAHSKSALEAQRMVTDATNDILRKNAELLHQGTVEIATENERGIVDIETLQHTNEELIATIDDLIRIQEDGRNKRVQAQAELANIENRLKQKMLEASRR